MATSSTQTDFVIYDEQFNSSMTERLLVNIQVWNSNSYGGLVLTTKLLMGHFNKVSMYKALAETVVKEYNPEAKTSTSWDTFEAFENVSVKVWRDVNIEKTIDAFTVMLQDPNATFSQLVGALTADLITEIKRVLPISLKTVPGVFDIANKKMELVANSNDNLIKNNTKGVRLSLNKKKDTYIISLYLIFIKNVNILDVALEVRKRAEYELSNKPISMDKKFYLNIYINDIHK